MESQQNAMTLQIKSLLSEFLKLYMINLQNNMEYEKINLIV